MSQYDELTLGFPMVSLCKIKDGDEKSQEAVQWYTPISFFVLLNYVFPHSFVFSIFFLLFLMTIVCHI